MCVCVYVCRCVGVYVCMCVCKGVCVCISMCVYMFVFVPVSMCTFDIWWKDGNLLLGKQEILSRGLPASVAIVL